MTSPVTASTVAVRVKLTLSVAASKTVLPASSTYVIVRLTVSFKSVVVTPAGYVGTAGQVGPLGLSGSTGVPGSPGVSGTVGPSGWSG